MISRGLCHDNEWRLVWADLRGVLLEPGQPSFGARAAGADVVATVIELLRVKHPIIMRCARAAESGIFRDECDEVGRNRASMQAFKFVAEIADRMWPLR